MSALQQHRKWGTRPGAVATVLAAWLGCTTLGLRGEGDRYPTPRAAAEALVAAIEQPEPEPMLDVLGHGYRDELVTADWDFNAETRHEIAARAREQLLLEERDDGSFELVIGPEEWPFPMPVVRDGDAWRFDTAAGIEEVLARRIGRNELMAIALLRAYVDAQIEYARVDRDGDGQLEYAQRIVSRPGQQDGLFWPDADGLDPSPFGPLVERAERYLDTTEPGDPFFGYYLRILTRRGETGALPAVSFVVDGNMTRGFAMVAYPAEYGVTGVMTFVVDQRGIVEQRDQGPFEGMDAYTPDDSWTLVEEDAP